MSFFDHFREEERPFVERIMEWTDQVRERYQIRTTDFLDPRQAFIVRSVVGHETGVYVRFFGGYEGAERQRAVIYPEYVEPEAQEFGLALIEITHGNRYIKLSHRDYLGAVLGLGVKRDKFGDLLLIDDDRCQLIVADEIADFVRLHLHQVNRVQVSADIVELDRIKPPRREQEIQTISVSSPRVDAITSEVYHLSRSKVVQPIKNGRLKVNWKQVETPSLSLEPGDVVSLKGFGRYQVLDIQGKSRKGRYILEIGKYV
ncbi:MAG: hypothetical protein H0Z33_04450 [Bacillaceae bacterium]|nr:hypothetical protein [Bacillaceae bacterium]